MSYRSIKRVLGETRLEWKCRLLFGVSLVALISGAFYWVGSVAEGLVIKNTRNKGSDLVVMLMQRTHFVVFLSETDKQLHDPVAYADSLNVDYGLSKEYKYEILTLGGESRVMQLNARPPQDALEYEDMRLLKEAFDKENKKLEEQKKAPGASAAAAQTQPEKPRAFRDRPDRKNDQYHYYEPIVLNAPRCMNCHLTPEDAGAIAASDPGGRGTASPPFLVAKVTIPYKETQAAINATHAVLWAVGIATVFLAMIALYVIVKYVIVKPLKHLRDVSDEISRGSVETRAEIRTGDEFQELADSFNRMLRHLTDTQFNLRQVNKELDAKVDELAQLNMRLYEMNRLKGDFLANMSHELRTPLNSIIGFSEVLQGLDALNDKQKRYAQNIQKSGRLLLEMINDILDLAKMEAGKMDIRLAEFQIEALLNAQCDMVRSLTEEKNIDLTVQIEPGLPPLFQDQGKVQQILTNLLSNAIKFTPEGGRIVVGARRLVVDRLELTVADTGVGIAPQDREIIFEKFRQGTAVIGEDGLTRTYSGTGLGLSIVRELCKLLGGEVSVESQVGHGSTFRVILPWTGPSSPRREANVQDKSAAVGPNWSSEPHSELVSSSSASNV